MTLSSVSSKRRYWQSGLSRGVVRLMIDFAIFESARLPDFHGSEQNRPRSDNMQLAEYLLAATGISAIVVILAIGKLTCSIVASGYPQNGFRDL